MSEMELGNPIPVDYEKKHKEEVVRATQLWECGDITRENLEYIFPELKESEDDKIRKAIIHYLNDSIGEGFPVIPKKDKIIRWIEWLEEQKEEEKKEEKKEDELLSIAKKEFLNKACRWVENIHDGTYLRNDDCGYTDIHWTEFIKDFRKAMEE